MYCEKQIKFITNTICIFQYAVGMLSISYIFDENAYEINVCNVAAILVNIDVLIHLNF